MRAKRLVQLCGGLTDATLQIPGTPQPAAAGGTVRADRAGQRIGTMEPVFGNIRHNKHLARLNLRGREKVNTQWHLYCMVHTSRSWPTAGGRDKAEPGAKPGDQKSNHGHNGGVKTPKITADATTSILTLPRALMCPLVGEIRVFGQLRWAA